MLVKTLREKLGAELDSKTGAALLAGYDLLFVQEDESVSLCSCLEILMPPYVVWKYLRNC